MAYGRASTAFAPIDRCEPLAVPFRAALCANDDETVSWSTHSFRVHVPGSGGV